MVVTGQRVIIPLGKSTGPQRNRSATGPSAVSPHAEVNPHWTPSPEALATFMEQSKAEGEGNSLTDPLLVIILCK